jgi:opacity protein-like surface antigen
MKKVQKLNFLAVTTISLACATSAFAAEACKAYVRADVGYNILGNSKVDAETFQSDSSASAVQNFRLPLTKASKGLIGAVGAGYAFNDAMRGEATFDFKPKIKSSFHSFEMETRILGGSAKVLYDFNNSTSVTPFLFASLGGASVKNKLSAKCDSAIGCTMTANDVIGLINVDSIGNPIVNGKSDSSGDLPGSSSLLAKIDMKAKTIVTYGAGFGLSFKASDNVNIDFTYGLNSGGSYSIVKNAASYMIDGGATSSGTATLDTGTSMSIKDAKLKRYFDQSLTAGVRVTL